MLVNEIKNYVITNLLTNNFFFCSYRFHSIVYFYCCLNFIFLKMKDCYFWFLIAVTTICAHFFLLLLHFAICGSYCFVGFNFFEEMEKLPALSSIFLWYPRKNGQWKFGWSNFLLTFIFDLFSFLSYHVRDYSSMKPILRILLWTNKLVRFREKFRWRIFVELHKAMSCWCWEYEFTCRIDYTFWFQFNRRASCTH